MAVIQSQNIIENDTASFGVAISSHDHIVPNPSIQIYLVEDLTSPDSVTLLFHCPHLEKPHIMLYSLC